MSRAVSIINVLVDHINRDYELSDGVRDWQKLPEIPTGGEILRPSKRSQNKWFTDNECKDDLNDKDNAVLPHNIIDRPWDSVEEYIGAHYQLLREDAIAPLRQAVSLYRSQPTMKDNQELSIYTHACRSISSVSYKLTRSAGLHSRYDLLQPRSCPSNRVLV
jgi:helicase required for RNAi-mediated heterochromatin assembly 1